MGRGQRWVLAQSAAASRHFPAPLIDDVLAGVIQDAVEHFNSPEPDEHVCGARILVTCLRLNPMPRVHRCIADGLLGLLAPLRCMQRELPLTWPRINLIISMLRHTVLSVSQLQRQTWAAVLVPLLFHFTEEPMRMVVSQMHLLFIVDNSPRTTYGTTIDCLKRMVEGPRPGARTRAALRDLLIGF